MAENISMPIDSLTIMYVSLFLFSFVQRFRVFFNWPFQFSVNFCSMDLFYENEPRVGLSAFFFLHLAPVRKLYGCPKRKVLLDFEHFLIFWTLGDPSKNT